ncbi:MAG TPA: diguanylate cyclase [Bacillus bacterium]|nr:diguanylate cyclase [Bacillus sp. (in: firmicutes)]
MKYFNFGRIGRNLFITSTTSGLIFIAFVFFCIWEIDHHFTANAKSQIEADEIETSLHTLYQSLLNQESGQRAFNLTGENVFLESFHDGLNDYNEASQLLLEKVEDKPDIKSHVSVIIEKGRYWQEQHGLKLVKMTKNGQQPSLESLGDSKAAFEEFRDSLEETLVLIGNLRDGSRNLYIGKIKEAKSILIALSIVLILLNALIINRQIKAIIQPVLALNKTVKAYTKKDFSVDIPQYNKKDELAELIKNVNTMRLELNEKFSTMESLAVLDGNTGIYNRRYFDQTLETIWTKAQNDAKQVSLILFDIDYFKNYNDTYGHLRGDQCLKKISNKLIELFGDTSDIVARFGGEEFAVILPEQNEEIAFSKAETLRRAVIDLEIPHHSSYVNKFLTISVGVASMFPAIGNRNSAHLITLADQALYKSKENGRNQITQYNSSANKTKSRKKNIRKKQLKKA